MVFLETRELTKRFFGITALDKVNIKVDQGQLLGLIGPNGSGKTTLFNCITGALRPDSGKVIFKDEDVTLNKSYEIALKGITRTFQIIRLFWKMTVVENMMLAVQQHQNQNTLAMMLQTPKIKNLEREAKERALELLELVEIIHVKDELACNLSYGQQKLLEIAMALMPNPEVVLLDEPTAAVNPVLTEKIINYIRELNKKGQTFILIEHKIDVIMTLCDRIIVLNHGEKIAEGCPEEIRDNKKVIDAYFGE